MKIAPAQMWATDRESSLAADQSIRFALNHMTRYTQAYANEIAAFIDAIGGKAKASPTASSRR